MLDLQFLFARTIRAVRELREPKYGKLHFLHVDASDLTPISAEGAKIKIHQFNL